MFLPTALTILYEHCHSFTSKSNLPGIHLEFSREMRVVLCSYTMNVSSQGILNWSIYILECCPASLKSIVKENLCLPQSQKGFVKTSLQRVPQPIQQSCRLSSASGVATAFLAAFKMVDMNVVLHCFQHVLINSMIRHPSFWEPFHQIFLRVLYYKVWYFLDRYIDSTLYPAQIT